MYLIKGYVRLYVLPWVGRSDGRSVGPWVGRWIRDRFAKVVKNMKMNGNRVTRAHRWLVRGLVPLFSLISLIIVLESNSRVLIQIQNRRFFFSFIFGCVSHLGDKKLCTSIYPSIRSFIHLSIHPSVHPFVCLFVRSFVCSFICSFIRTSIINSLSLFFIYLLMCLSLC